MKNKILRNLCNELIVNLNYKEKWNLSKEDCNLLLDEVYPHIEVCPKIKAYQNLLDTNDNIKTIIKNIISNCYQESYLCKALRGDLSDAMLELVGRFLIREFEQKRNSGKKLTKEENDLLSLLRTQREPNTIKSAVQDYYTKEYQTCIKNVVFKNFKNLPEKMEIDDFTQNIWLMVVENLQKQKFHHWSKLSTYIYHIILMGL